MNPDRRRVADGTLNVAIAVIVIIGLLYSYIPFPESWERIREDGTTKADDLWYIGFAVFMVLNSAAWIFYKKPSLKLNIFFFLSLMFLVDRFVTPYYATRLEWLGVIAIIIAETARQTLKKRG